MEGCTEDKSNGQGSARERRGDEFVFVLIVGTGMAAHPWLFRPCHGKDGEFSVGAGASFQAMRTISQLQSGESMDELARAQWRDAARARG